MHATNTVQADQIGPISVEQPCGPDLEYDAAFLALQQAATGSREQQFGDTLIPSVTPDWRQVAALAIGLLNRTVDLRIIALLTLAWTQLEHLAGYAKGLTLVADILDRHWEHVHPQIQAADAFDPLPRLNAIAALTDRQALGGSVRGATLLHWRFGQLSLRDTAAILNGSQTSGANVISAPGIDLQSELRAALKGARDEVAVVAQVLQAIERIQQQISVNLGASCAPDPSAVESPLRAVYQAAREPLQPNLASIDRRVEPFLTRPINQAARVERIAGAHAAPTGPLSIQSRDDVLVALDKACVYLESAEPGHPAPLLLRRVQRLMHMNFYEIVRDMAPAALPQLDALAGPMQPSESNANK